MRTEPAKTETERVNSLDMMRGIAVLMMVFFHASQLSSGDVFVRYNQINNVFSPLRMPVLFLISGIAAAGLLRKGRASIASRCLALVWLYLIWIPVNMHNGLTWHNWAMEALRPLSFLWFIEMLAILTLSIALVRSVARFNVLAVSVLVASIAYTFDLPVVAHNNLLRYSCFFYAGLLYREEIKEVLLSKYLTIAIGLAAVTFAVMYVINRWLLSAIDWPALAVFERFAACALGLYVIRFFEKMKLGSDLLQWIGRRTLPIYVMHGPIIWVMVMLIGRYGKIDNVIDPPILAAFSVCCALAFYRLANGAGLTWLYSAPPWFSNAPHYLSQRLRAYQLNSAGT